MDCFTILAQAAETTAAEEAIVPIDLIWEQITSLGVVEALTFISFGTVCLFYGWRVFKILVTICFALIGLLLGIQLNQLVEGTGVWLGIIGMVLFAFLSVPLMRWGVSILGAVAGGIITGGAWLAFNLLEQYIWVGGIIGVVAGFMISFIIFKAAVVLFTSLGGSSLVVVGVLAIMHKYMGISEKLQELVFNQKWFLPVLLLVPIVVGIVLQLKLIRGAKDWDI